MSFQAKTARDMPVGSEVASGPRDFQKVDPGVWVREDGVTYSDVAIDALLDGGGTIMFIPAGQGVDVQHR